MSAHTTEHKDDRDVPELPCPACIEAAAEKNGGLAPEYALQKYHFNQLMTHLESNVHNQKDFVSVALRASIHLYRIDSAHDFRKIGL
jgi:hypothetical protein